MGFRYIIERVSANGTREVSFNDYDVSELTIGRGGNALIIINSRYLSLVHARFLYSAGSIVVEDLNSLSGVRVNGKKISRAEVSPDDKIQLGDLELTVGRDGKFVTLTERQEGKPQVEDAALIAQGVKALSISTYLPRMSLLCAIIGLITFVAYGILPRVGANQQSWSSGPIANVHKMIEGDCTSCHSKNFTHVQDADCLKCHNLTEHSPELKNVVSKNPSLNFECAHCHMDHNGNTGIIAKESELCTSCHANMQGTNKGSDLKNIPSFENHPEFMVGVKDLAGGVAYLPVTDPTAVDRTPIKLNHAVHLRAGLRGPKGPVTLDCQSCHKLASDFRTIEPINFDKNCRECHSLGFDDRLPKAQVPHGDDDGVYPSLFTEYTKLLLLKSVQNDNQASSPPPEFLREKPGGTSAPAAQPKAEVVNTTLVVQEARKAEREIFLKTACFLCHDAKVKATSEQTTTNSHYVVLKPEIPNRWLGRSIFSHGAHEEVACESCHEKARKSFKTSDVLLPSIKECQKCHSQAPRESYVTSDCVMCHSYHDSLPIDLEHKRTTGDYLSFVKRGEVKNDSAKSDTK